MAKKKQSSAAARHRIIGSLLVLSIVASGIIAAINLPVLAANQNSAWELANSPCTSSSSPDPDWPNDTRLKVNATVSTVTTNGPTTTIVFKTIPSGIPGQYGNGYISFIRLIPDSQTDVGNGTGMARKLITSFADGSWFSGDVYNGTTVNATGTGNPEIHFELGCNASGSERTRMLDLVITKDGAYAPPQPAYTYNGSSSEGGSTSTNGSGAATGNKTAKAKSAGTTQTTNPNADPGSQSVASGSEETNQEQSLNKHTSAPEDAIQQTRSTWLLVIMPIAVLVLAFVALFALPNVRTHFTLPLLSKFSFFKQQVPGKKKKR